jgi:glucokinase
MYYVGVDVGGTNLVAGVVTEDDQVISHAKCRASQCKTAAEMTHAIVTIARQAVEEAGVPLEEIAHVGVGIPGAVERKDKFIYKTVNAPYEMYPFGQEFQKEWDIPVYLENDANCAVIAEFLAGAAQGTESAMMVTLGTGVGGGFINYGRLEGGINLTGMEVGHMVVEVDGIPCPCGRKGCWEQYSSANGLKRATREAIERHPDSLLAQIAQEDGKVGGRTAFLAARQGCPVAERVTEGYLKFLIEGLTNLVNIFQPEVIVLGGGVSNERDEDFLLPIRRHIAGFHYTKAGLVQTKIIKAGLGGDAGIIGASLLGRVYLLGK